MVAALNLEDYDVRVGKLVVHDKKRKAETLCLDDETDRNLSNWLKIRGWEYGPIFWAVTIGGKLKPRRMTLQAIRAVLSPGTAPVRLFRSRTKASQPLPIPSQLLHKKEHSSSGAGCKHQISLTMSHFR